MEEYDKKIYSQVVAVLNTMDKFYVKKIPMKLRRFFEQNQLQNYEFKINKNIRLKEQNLDKKTLSILAALDINYWCFNEEEKNVLIKKYAYNDKKREDELREKYNVDKLFDKKATVCETRSMVKFKPQKWYNKLFDKIKRFFLKN